MTRRCESFRRRLRDGDLIAGTFLKTPSPIIAEVMALSDLDAFCIDVEHAPFGRLELDGAIAMLRAADAPTLVRTPSDGAADIRNALDCGATGILVPHVTTASQAAAIARAAHFGEGGRGYAGSHRAAGYTTTPMSTHLDQAKIETTVVVQIEDIAGIDNAAAIAATDGIDAVFIGRGDLAVAMGKSPADPEVVEIVQRICADVRGVGTTVGMWTPETGELRQWIALGATLFLLSSEQSLMLGAANALAATVRQADSR